MCVCAGERLEQLLVREGTDQYALANSCVSTATAGGTELFSALNLLGQVKMPGLLWIMEMDEILLKLSGYLIIFLFYFIIN